jgi:ubiquinone/menaquinone biosynthesis C-methylase UbiE
MEKFILTNAEDMKEVEDNSMDVVVSTLVLCSVRNVKQTLKEVHRVLAPVSVTQFTCVSFPVLII